MNTWSDMLNQPEYPRGDAKNAASGMSTQRPVSKLSVEVGPPHGFAFCMDNQLLLQQIPSESIDLVYIDPPFNTGKAQRRSHLRTVRDDAGDRIGFGGKSYRTELVTSKSYDDHFDNYLEFLNPRLKEVHRILKPTGSLYFHIDYREVHYCKILLDQIFGRANFVNEIIWAYDYGARPKKRWPAKHDNILLFAKDESSMYFNSDEVERIPYMAPGLVTAEKASKGKLPTDTWWHTIVSPTGKEKTGYPTQKPLGILKRIVAASCPQRGVVLDVFSGSGTTAHAAALLNRRFVVCDRKQDAMDILQARLRDIGRWVPNEVQGMDCLAFLPHGQREAAMVR